MFSFGSASATAMAARKPAPPAPTMAMSVVMTSIGYSRCLPLTLVASIARSPTNARPPADRPALFFHNRKRAMTVDSQPLVSVAPLVQQGCRWHPGR